MFATNSIADSTSTAWSICSNGLPYVLTEMLKWRPSDNTVTAFTYGRDAFTTNYFTNASCAFTFMYFYDTIVGGSLVTLKGKIYSKADNYTDTVYHKSTHCDPIINYITITSSIAVQDIRAFEGKIKTFPNPYNNVYFNIYLPTVNYTGNVQIDLTYKLGQVVYHKDVQANDRAISTSLYQPGLAASVYFIRFTMALHNLVKTVVISK